MRTRLLRLAPLTLAVACGPTEPSPSPSPTATPDPCATAPSAHAKAVLDSWIPACSLAQNIYDDPTKALGPPDAGGSGPSNFTGFVSLGLGGRVTVDLGGCISDVPGPDLRVYQAVSSEEVSVYVSLLREGPYTLVEARKACGEPYSGIRRYCDFDIASGGVGRARYVRMADTARARLARFGAADLHLDLLGPDRAAGPGVACVLGSQTAHTVLAGAEVAQRGVPAEEIAARRRARPGRRARCRRDPRPACRDQLLIYLALAGERSRFVVREFSSHARTTAWLIEQFLPARITATPCATGTAVEFEPLPAGVGAQN